LFYVDLLVPAISPVSLREEPVITSVSIGLSCTERWRRAVAEYAGEFEDEGEEG
jgi:hypothetical protein